MPARASRARRGASRAASALSAEQLVEPRHFRRTRRCGIGELHCVHQQRRHKAPPSRLRWRSLAGQRRHLWDALCRRRRRAAEAGGDVPVLGRERRRRSCDRSRVPFYPIPAQSITQPHWVEGGAPGNVDQRSQGDRHLLIVDCTNKFLYEPQRLLQREPGEVVRRVGAFFDMNTNNRRPDMWTSADAAGLAIFPASFAMTRRGILQ